MTDPTAEFIHQWLLDIEGILKRHRENLKDDLWSDDERTRKQADRTLDEVCEWLEPPLPQPTDEQKVATALGILGDETVSPTIRLKPVSRLIRSGGRGRGRPRTETAQLAIRALSLHYATSSSWREIALKLRGCKHARPNRDRSCKFCGDSIRDAAGRLEKFLQSIGYNPIPSPPKTPRPTH
jgi:hypothetical protein